MPEKTKFLNEMLTALNYRDEKEAASIKNMPNLHLHILLTEEDGVIIARCLNFSVSSHGEDEEDAPASLTESIKDYLNYALEQKAFSEIIDPEDDKLWEMYRKLELQDESLSFQEKAESLRTGEIEQVVYA